MTAVLQVNGLEKVFGGIRAVNGVSFEVREGEILGLIGPNGSGKSTLFNCILGQLAPSAGEVRIDGEKVAGPRPDKVGVVFQESLLLPWKTAVENIEFPLALCGVPAGERRSRANALLELVRLIDFANRLPDELSGGMKQRVAIARALVRHPRVLLMDEPFAAVDPVVRARLQDEFLRLQGELDKTVVLVTHDIDEAVKMGDKVAILAQGGRLAQFGTPAGTVTVMLVSPQVTTGAVMPSILTLPVPCEGPKP